jgi:protein phosphatase
MITRALGLEPGVVVDLEALELLDGDRVLLCSDGLTTMLREDRIGEILRDEADGDAAARQLVDEANAAGGADNITVLIIDLEDDGEATEEDSAAQDAVDDGSVETAADPSLDVTQPVEAVTVADDGAGDDGDQGTRRGIFRRRKR